MPRDEASLLDILRAVRLDIRFRGDLSQADFESDLKTQSAVLHQLLVIGEAVKRLSSDSERRTLKFLGRALLVCGTISSTPTM